MACNMRLDEQLNRMKSLIGLKEGYSYEVKENITLYHAILKNKFNTFEELMHEIFTNGLKPNNNGEVGNAIWLATNTEYANDDRELSFTIEYNQETKEKYEIIVDKPNAWAYRPIPFEELTCYTLPVQYNNSGYLNNKDCIRFYSDITEDNLAKWLKYEAAERMFFYEGIFRQTVQPFCKIDIMNFFKEANPKYMNNNFDKYKFKI